MVGGTQVTERGVKNTSEGGGEARWGETGPNMFCPRRKKTLLGHSVGVPIDLSMPDVFIA